MPIFRRYVDVLLPKVPTVLRRMQTNIINLTHRVQFEAMDALASALEQYIDAWPIDTAPGWLLDEHWLPYHNLQRNGLTDAQARQFIHAKRLLNKSWGSGDQALEILQVLLPTATFKFDYFAPKAWKVTITGMKMEDAKQALTFMEKRPSPAGGGFSAAGDNGTAIIMDENVMSFASIYGNVVRTGWFGSIYGNPGSDTAGYAHVANI